MIYYNTGYIQVKEEDVKALIVAINATEIFGFDLDVTDFYKHCGMAVYDLCEITGDIEDNLPGWNVIIGTEESMEIPKFLKEYKAKQDEAVANA